jgi:hypothetical protein
MPRASRDLAHRGEDAAPWQTTRCFCSARLTPTASTAAFLAPSLCPRSPTSFSPSSRGESPHASRSPSCPCSCSARGGMVVGRTHAPPPPKPGQERRNGAQSVAEQDTGCVHTEPATLGNHHLRRGNSTRGGCTCGVTTRNAWHNVAFRGCTCVEEKGGNDGEGRRCSAPAIAQSAAGTSEADRLVCAARAPRGGEICHKTL